ncbi:hypothetical protein E2C01_073813 [Portunus trituberculatus]|uniref:Uncharacterized protein n=1 Tax=Portunus trituberculatus TaxID=210409 RepID=A0A5B7IAQ1_PORTR|nr:hypothetical protein [Portunus trituberculatus]
MNGACYHQKGRVRANIYSLHLGNPEDKLRLRAGVGRKRGTAGQASLLVDAGVGMVILNSWICFLQPLIYIRRLPDSVSGWVGVWVSLLQPQET